MSSLLPSAGAPPSSFLLSSITPELVAQAVPRRVARALRGHQDSHDGLVPEPGEPVAVAKPVRARAGVAFPRCHQ
jgi:hypothetical protein